MIWGRNYISHILLFYFLVHWYAKIVKTERIVKKNKFFFIVDVHPVKDMLIFHL